VWRLLAETQMLQGDAAAAAASYETANSRAGGGSIELLSSWTDALVAANKPQKVDSTSCRSSAGRKAITVVARCR
jgi:cytochrome c-type biogenesis protein CcmH/NrfG